MKRVLILITLVTAMAVSGTQRRTTSGSSVVTATPRSPKRALTAEPTRPEPMTWTLSLTISLQLRCGCRAARIVLVPQATSCSSAWQPRGSRG